jgi:hypothetical protein
MEKAQAAKNLTFDQECIELAKKQFSKGVLGTPVNAQEMLLRVIALAKIGASISFGLNLESMEITMPPPEPVGPKLEDVIWRDSTDRMVDALWGGVVLKSELDDDKQGSFTFGKALRLTLRDPHSDRISQHCIYSEKSDRMPLDVMQKTFDDHGEGNTAVVFSGQRLVCCTASIPFLLNTYRFIYPDLRD